MSDFPYFTQKFDRFFKVHINKQIDEVEAFIANAIEHASKETILSRTHHSHEKPWSNQEYQDLLLKHREEKDPTKWKSLTKEVKKLSTKLKNAYFKTL